MQRFELGDPEFGKVVANTESGKAQFRFMGPLVTTRSCLACHAIQRYQEGDIRGGISVSYHAEQIFLGDAAQIRNAAVIHGPIFLIVTALRPDAGDGRLRGQHQTAHVGAISGPADPFALSAKVMAEGREGALQASMDDLIAKPIDVDKMFRTMLRWRKPAKRPVSGARPGLRQHGAR